MNIAFVSFTHSEDFEECGEGLFENSEYIVPVARMQDLCAQVRKAIEKKRGTKISKYDWTKVDEKNYVLAIPESYEDDEETWYIHVYECD